MGKPTVISLFAGIGGLDLAAHWAGFETVRFVEKEPFCQKILAKHWPNVPIDDDVFTSHPPHADAVIGGFPCQPFSVAGNRQGADDERYLLPEMLRIVREVQPYAVLFENVPGFPSLSNGAEFKYLLGALAEMGFDAEWGHIRASDTGAPHTRERWFLVAYTSGIGRNQRVNHRQERHLLHDLNGNAAQGQSKRQGWQRGLGTTSEVMGNTASTGLEGGNGSQSALPKHTRPIESVGTAYKKEGRIFEPQLGRTADGLPGRLDFVGFPARPGEPQHAYEPPRTAASTPTTNARIKALGNAVVPAVAYPIFAALAEWFAELHAQAA